MKVLFYMFIVIFLINCNVNTSCPYYYKIFDGDSIEVIDNLSNEIAYSATFPTAITASIKCENDSFKMLQYSSIYEWSQKQGWHKNKIQTNGIYIYKHKGKDFISYDFIYKSNFELSYDALESANLFYKQLKSANVRKMEDVQKLMGILFNCAVLGDTLSKNRLINLKSDFVEISENEILFYNDVVNYQLKLRHIQKINVEH